MICLYSTSAHSLLWVREDIDAYISLQNTVYQWRIKLAKWSIAIIGPKSSQRRYR